MGIEPQVKAGGMKPQNHNEPVRVRTALKAGGRYLNHNSMVVREACAIRREPKRMTRPEERLEVLVVRAVPTADSLARP